MKQTNPKALAQTLSEARRYLDKLTSDPKVQPDFERMHRYINILRPHLQGPSVPGDLVRTMAQLYFESMRYAESAQILLRLKDRSFHEMRHNNDFYNSYYIPSNNWEERQKLIWDTFSKLEACPAAERKQTRPWQTSRTAWTPTSPPPS